MGMFFVSGIRSDGLVGVTDTSDWVVEFYKKKDLVRLIETQKVKIFGASVYNHELEPTILTLDKVLDACELKKRIDAWRALHNPWTGLPVENYLAEAVVGTAITVGYHMSDTSGRMHNGASRLVKLSYDEWDFYDPDNIFSNSKVDSRVAADLLEVACIYSKPVSMLIVWGEDGNSFSKISM